MEHQFKEGDWCFYNFKLCQITEVEHGVVRIVTDPYGSAHGSSLNDGCFPLSMDVLLISDAVRAWLDKFHRPEHNGLNHADLHNALVEQWISICKTEEGSENRTMLLNDLRDFGYAVIDASNERRKVLARGVHVFRQ